MSFRITTWNVNGIRACAKKGFVDTLKSLSPDLICLQEVRAQPEQMPKEIKELKGWSMHWHSGQRPGYSGVGCLSLHEPTEVIHGIGIEEFDREGRCLQVLFEHLAVINSYVPNGGRGLERVDYKLRYYDALLKRSNTLTQMGYQVLLTGDWNTCHREIDLARPKANVKNTGFLPEERAWIDKFIDSQHVDCFRKEFPDSEGAYSWWSQRGGARENNVGWRLDYFLASKNAASHCTDNKIHSSCLGSDHCPVSLQWTQPI